MLKKAFYLAILSLIIIIIIYSMVKDFSYGKSPNWGVTFSSFYAKELGLNPDEVLSAILSDLKIKYLRLPVYWPQVENKKNEFDFSTVDKQMILANKYNAKVILVVGERVPRWPECHIPIWAKKINTQEFDKRTNLLIKKTIEHFKVYSNIIAWQVNNEPFLNSFGNCRKISKEKLKQQIYLIKNIDSSRPIMITESGELSTWIKSGKLADTVGISLYRTVWNQYFGYWRYPIPPAYYRWHADIVMKFFPVKKIIISEMQAEPWPPGKHILQTDIDEQFKSFSSQDFIKIKKYVKKIGFSEVYMWGAEWWYWMANHGHPEFWQYAKGFINEK